MASYIQIHSAPWHEELTIYANGISLPLEIRRLTYSSHLRHMAPLRDFIMPSTLQCFVLASIAIAWSPSVIAQVADNRLDRLSAIWESSSTEIFSADLVAHRALIYTGGQSSTLTRDSIRQFAQDTLLPLLNPSVDSSMLEDKSRVFFLQHGLPNTHWATIEIVHDQGRTRNDMLFSRNGKPQQDIRVRDSTREIAYSSENSYASSKDKPSAVKLYTIRDIRFVPILKTSTTPSLDTVDDGLLRLTFDETHNMTVDPQSGFVHSISTGASEFMQFAPRDVQGVLIPGMRIDIDYDNKNNGVQYVKRATILVVASVRINEEISAERFEVTAPKSTTVAVHSTEDSDGRPRLGKTTTSIPDVKSYAAALPPNRTTTIPSNRLGGIAMVVGLVVVVLCVTVWLRFRASHA